MVSLAVFQFLRHFFPNFYWRFLIGGIAGALCGLIPYFVGRHKNKSLAETAMLSCVIAGSLLGLILALPVSIGFTIALLRKPAVKALLDNSQ
jgi:hypothetical protein